MNSKQLQQLEAMIKKNIEREELYEAIDDMLSMKWDLSSDDVSYIPKNKTMWINMYNQWLSACKDALGKIG